MTGLRLFFIVLLACCMVSNGQGQSVDTLWVESNTATSRVLFDAEDIVVWPHPAAPELSLIIGTDKGTFPDGGIFVWNLSGILQQRINISHPNSIDIRQGISLGNNSVDVVVVTMRDHRQIRIFRIDRDERKLVDVTSPQMKKIFKEPYGLALYKRPVDQALFAFVSSKSHDFRGELWLLRLADNGTGYFDAEIVRKMNLGNGIFEGMIVDDALGFLYAAEDSVGVHKYNVNAVGREDQLALFAGPEEVKRKVEDLALYKCENGSAFILASSPGTASIRIYKSDREGDNRHRYKMLHIIKNRTATAGDGITVANTIFTESFPFGFLAWHNESMAQFRLFRLEQLAQQGFQACTEKKSLSSAGSDAGEMKVVPEDIMISNYPNPFNGSTRITFELSESSKVDITLYNTKGESVKNWPETTREAGKHSLSWDGRYNSGMMAPSGVYLLKINTGSGISSHKVIFAK